MLVFQLDAQVWFEWIDSDSNWADGVSRVFEADTLAEKHKFRLQPMQSPIQQGSRPWAELWEAARSSIEQALEV